MTLRVVNGANLFAVEKDRQRIVKRDDRQRLLWRGRRCSSGRVRTAFEALAHVVVSDNRRLGTKRRIRPGVIAVPMSVEHVAQLSFAETLERGADFVGKRRELIVYYKNPVGSDRHSDVSPLAFEHVHIAGDMG